VFSYEEANMKFPAALLISCFFPILFVNSTTVSARCLKGDCYSGYGTYQYASGNEYTGTFKNGLRSGQGIFLFADGEKYIGEYRDGKRWGMGTYFFKNGMKYEGEYENDERNGIGIFTLPNGARYEGEYRDGLKHGKGKFFFPDGRAVTGSWKYGAFIEPTAAPVISAGTPAATYSLLINTFPENAKVRFLDRELKYEPDMELLPGRYKVEVSHDKYETKVEYIDILDSDLIVPITLKLAVIPYLQPEFQKMKIMDEDRLAEKEGQEAGASVEGKGPETEAGTETSTDRKEPAQEIAMVEGDKPPVENDGGGLSRGVDLNEKNVRLNSLFTKEEQGDADKQMQEIDRQRINAALAETENSQKLSMVEQVQQEVEMLKASFGDPKLLSIKPLPGSNTSYERVALVIGNSQYPLIGELKNPEHDAKDIAEALRKLNFNVDVKLNVDQEELENAIIEFGEKIKKDSVALFYYAGHGVQMEGNNYLLPVQSGIKRARDIRYKAVDLNMLIDEMTAAKNGKNIIILDACRNNPLPQEDNRHQTVGLARTDAPAGTLIAYATSPGSVAIDGEGRNGIYTSYLLENIFLPGLPIEMVFKRVLQGVAADTDRKQIPWMSSSLDIDFSFAMN